MAEPPIKRAKLDDEVDNDGVDHDALTKLQDDLDRVNEEASIKVLEIEAYYNKRRQPIYTERSRHLLCLPAFWATVLRAHHDLCEIITEADLRVLEYLKELTVTDSEDIKSGFTISCSFRDNPFFTNLHLVKAFTFSEQGNRASGLSMGWRPEHSPAALGPEAYCFISWLAEPLDLPVEQTDHISSVIKHELWPNPLKYYYQEEEEEEGEEEEEEGVEGEEGYLMDEGGEFGDEEGLGGGDVDDLDDALLPGELEADLEEEGLAAVVAGAAAAGGLEGGGLEGKEEGEDFGDDEDEEGYDDELDEADEDLEEVGLEEEGGVEGEEGGAEGEEEEEEEVVEGDDEEEEERAQDYDQD